MYKSTIFWNNFHQYHLIMFLNFNTDMKPNTCIHVTGNNRNLFPIKKKNITFVPLPHVAFIVPIPWFLQHALGVDVVILSVLGRGLGLLQTLSSVVIGRLGGYTVSERVSGTLINWIKYTFRVLFELQKHWITQEMCVSK